MRDLKTKLDIVEHVPLPDVWHRVEARVEFLPPGGSDLPVPATPVRHRVGAAIVAFALFAAVVGLALGAFDRPATVPGNLPPDPGQVTFSFGFGPAAVYVNGARVQGDMDVAPKNSGVFYMFDPNRMVDVPAGARIVVESNVEKVRGWIDICCDASKPPLRLYELHLADSASMPSEPGTYFVEFYVWWPHSEGGLLTFLFPVRVMAPETP